MTGVKGYIRENLPKAWETILLENKCIGSFIEQFYKAIAKPKNKNKYPKDFNAQDFFAPYYGVFRNAQPTKVVIEANSKSTQFLRLLPLHPSQKEVQTIGDKTIFEYFIAPTFDFIQELRTHGSDIRIIAPDVLVNKFKEEAQKAYLMYCQQEESTK